MGLTTHQNEKLEDSLEILKVSNRILITGSAGVGKTFLVNELIKKLSLVMPSSRKIFCSAPTKYPPLKNVGLFIIDEVSMLNTELLKYVETHALKNNTTVVFIGDKKQLNPVGEEESPVFLGQPYNFDNEEDAEAFSKSQIRKCTIIKNKVTGYTLYLAYPEVELTEIIRQGEGNPIIDLSRDLDSIAK